MTFLSQLHLLHVQPLWMGNHAANYSFTAGIGLDVCLHIVHWPRHQAAMNMLCSLGSKLAASELFPCIFANT